MNAPADDNDFENDNDGYNNNNDENGNNNGGNENEVDPTFPDLGNNGANTPIAGGGANNVKKRNKDDEESSSDSESSDSSTSDSSDSSSSKNHSKKKKSRNKSRRRSSGKSSGKNRKSFKELDAEVLRKHLEGLTKTPNGSRKVERQLFDKDGNEVATPKLLNSSKRSTPGTSGSRKRKHDDDSDDDTEEDVDATISMIEKNYLTPTKAGGESDSDDDNRHDLLESSTIKAELGRRTSKRLKRCHENYTSKGPPVLGENPSVENFYAWKANLKIFIERMPGYVNGMLKKRPDFDNLKKRDQKMLIEVYQNIMVWLAKAGSDNRKVNSKTKGVAMKPYPDIVGWWKSVNDIFALSQITLDNMKSKLHAVYQLKGEKLVSYYTRFETKVNELKDLGMQLKSSKMGLILFKGLLGYNRRTITMFLNENRVKCTLHAMNSICKWLDDLDEDRHPDRPEDEKISVHLAQVNQERHVATPEKYGPGERTVKFEKDGVKFRLDNQSGRGRFQFRGSNKGGARGGQGRGGGFENGGGTRNNDYNSYRGPNSPGQGFQEDNRKLSHSPYRGDTQNRQQQEAGFRGNGNQSGGRYNHSYDYRNEDRRDSYRSPQQLQYRSDNEEGGARNEYMNRHLQNDIRYNNGTNSPIAPRCNNGTYPVLDGNRGKVGSPMDQPLMFKL